MKYNKEVLKHMLQEFYKLHKRIPKSKEFFSGYGLASIATYKSNFGSIREALEYAGLPTGSFRNRPKSYNDMELLYLFIRLQTILGRDVTYSDLNGVSEDFPHIRTYEKRFGSFANVKMLSDILSNIDDLDKLDEFAEYVRTFVEGTKKTKVKAVTYTDDTSLTYEEIDHIILALEEVYDCFICKSALNKLRTKRKELTND